MNKNFKDLVTMIEDKTYLSRGTSAEILLQEEDKILQREIYKNNNNMENDYYYLATAIVINKYNKNNTPTYKK